MKCPITGCNKILNSKNFKPHVSGDPPNGHGHGSFICRCGVDVPVRLVGSFRGRNHLDCLEVRSNGRFRIRNLWINGGDSGSKFKF